MLTDNPDNVKNYEMRSRINKAVGSCLYHFITVNRKEKIKGNIINKKSKVKIKKFGLKNLQCDKFVETNVAFLIFTKPE